jgi:hypothetical protein
MTLGKFSAVFTASMQSAVINTIGSWNGMHADYVDTVNFSGKNLNKYSRKEGLDTQKSEPARAQQCEHERF